MSAPPPTTYAAWSELLDRFERAEDDQETLARLIGAVLPTGPGVEERLFKRASQAFEARINRVTKNMTKGWERGMDDVTYTTNVAAARREVTLIARFAGADCWGIRMGKPMVDALRNYVTESQKNIEAAAKDIALKDGGRQLSMVRSFPLAIDEAAGITPVGEKPSGTAADAAPPGPPQPPPSRRILF